MNVIVIVKLCCKIMYFMPLKVLYVVSVSLASLVSLSFAKLCLSQSTTKFMLRICQENQILSAILKLNICNFRHRLRLKHKIQNHFHPSKLFSKYQGCIELGDCDTAIPQQAVK